MDYILVTLMDFFGYKFSEYFTFVNKKPEMKTGGIVVPAYKAVLIVF